MEKPIPFPQLAQDRQVYVNRAHRMRGEAVAGLVREFARWVSRAAR